MLSSVLGKKFAVNSLVLILALVVVFHVMVLAGFIPHDLVWGGALKDPARVLLLETISICINMLMLVTVLIKGGYLSIRMSDKPIQVALWLMFSLFLLNTVGNIFSENKWETIIFTPLTLFLAIMSFRLAID